MAYKNKHIVNFGLSDSDYNLMMSLYEISYCSSIAEFFRLCLHSYSNNFKSQDYVNSIKRDVNSLKNTLYECMGVIKHD